MPVGTALGAGPGNEADAGLFPLSGNVVGSWLTSGAGEGVGVVDGVGVGNGVCPLEITSPVTCWTDNARRVQNAAEAICGSCILGSFWVYRCT